MALGKAFLLTDVDVHRNLGERFGNLAYKAHGKRDLRIDLLRGFAVFAMVVDHLAGPSFLQSVTGGNRFFTSAAEGFIFISGLMVGMVYAPMLVRDGPGDTLRRLLTRGWQLYVLAVGLAFVMVPISEILQLPWAEGLDRTNPVDLVVSIVTLHQTYYLIDVPLLYALLLLIAPAALLLMSGGRTWIVLLTSWTLWVLYQFFPGRAEVPWPIAGNSLFAFSAWQVVFFSAMTIGYHQQWLQSKIGQRWRVPLLAGSGLIFVLLLALSHSIDPVLRALAAGEGPTQATSISPALVAFLFSKGTVGPGRLVASAVVFSFLYLVVTTLWRPLYRSLAWLLLPLGQNALYAYAVHVVLALGVGILRGAVALPDTRATNAAVQLIGLGLIWLAIRYRVLIPTKSNRRWWMVSPVPVAVVLIVLLPIFPGPGLSGIAAAAPPAGEVQAARVFGTPIPRATAIQEGTTQPPPPVTTPVPLQAASVLLPAGRSDDPYVGPIQGTLREFQFYSESLDRDMPYFIYLPPGYGADDRRYPVVYMLHGGSGDKEEWLAYGFVDMLDAQVQSKQIRPMIAVFPQGDWGYWTNQPNGGPAWGDYVALDLTRHIDASYRTLPDSESRAVGGLSMGAHGALQLTFNYPDIFGAAGAHSPSLREDDGTIAVLGTGDEFAARDPISLAAAESDVNPPLIWIDIGADDIWLPRAQILHQTLLSANIPHEWRVLPGDHDGGYWRGNLSRYLSFYDHALHDGRVQFAHAAL